MGQAGLGHVESHIHRAYGEDPIALGRNDPEELLDWWLRIAAMREEWNK